MHRAALWLISIHDCRGDQAYICIHLLSDSHTNISECTVRDVLVGINIVPRHCLVMIRVNGRPHTYCHTYCQSHDVEKPCRGTSTGTANPTLKIYHDKVYLINTDFILDDEPPRSCRKPGCDYVSQYMVSRTVHCLVGPVLVGWCGCANMEIAVVIRRACIQPTLRNLTGARLLSLHIPHEYNSIHEDI
jgi:hypothetical protein